LGVACYFAGPTVSSFVNGLAGFFGALVAGMLGRLRGVLHRAALREWGISRVPQASPTPRRPHAPDHLA
jgi:hypothetical protein